MNISFVNRIIVNYLKKIVKHNNFEVENVSTTDRQYIEGRVIVNYNEARVEDMKKIKENFCIATEKMVIEQISDEGMKVNEINHANNPNGVVDLVLKFNGPRNNLSDLYSHLKKIEKPELGIGKIDIYLPTMTKQTPQM